MTRQIVLLKTMVAKNFMRIIEKLYTFIMLLLLFNEISVETIFAFYAFNFQFFFQFS